MDITYNLVREVLAGCLDDDPVLKTLVSALAQPIPREALIYYLFTEDVIEQALIQRLRSDVEGTFDDLCALADGLMPDSAEPVAAVASSQKKKGRRDQPAAKGAKAAKKGRKKQRRVADIAGLKQQVVEFLRTNPKSNRRAISEAVKLPSSSVYNRVIGSLREEGLIVAEGERWRMVYSAVTQTQNDDANSDVQRAERA